MPVTHNSAELRVAAIHQHVTIFEVFERMGLDEPAETHQMRCPFHEDHSPSARVYADQNKLYCFTCQRGWDVVDAVATHWRLSFTEALNWLEQEFGVPGVLQGLTGTIRTQLASRVEPELGHAAELVEQTLKTRRAQLGFSQYAKCLYALDLTVYEASERRITGGEAQRRLLTILKAGRA